MGIDVSHYQGVINWSAVKAAGNAFAFAKALDGEHTEDPTFRANWKGMLDAGVVRGSYNFYHAQEDPVVQATNYANLLKAVGYTNADLPPALDLEDRNGADAIGKQRLLADVHAWMHTVKAALGRKPILYVDHSFVGEWLDGSFVGPDGETYADLWIARYGVSDPGTNGAWGTNWTFWQNSSSAVVPGVAGRVDQDHFVGGPEGLAAYVQGTILTP